MTFTVTRAPLRVSLFGGGTDRPEFYKKHGYGEVLSFAIDKYMHVVLNKVNNSALKVMYSQIEIVNNLSYLKHDIIRELWRYGNYGMGWEIASFADLPTVGTGLGSSSSFAVALGKALTHHIPTPIGLKDIAENACFVEMELCKSPIGKQDQYAAAYGGINIIEFADGNVLVKPQDIVTGHILRDNLMLFYTGLTRKTNEVLSQQTVDGNNEQVLLAMREQVGIAKGALDAREYDVIGELLHEAWNLKRQLPGSTNSIIDEIYDKAYRAGALGGKVLGAGGGGFMMFYVPQKHQNTVREVLKPLVETRFNIAQQGVETLTHR